MIISVNKHMHACTNTNLHDEQWLW